MVRGRARRPLCRAGDGDGCVLGGRERGEEDCWWLWGFLVSSLRHGECKRRGTKEGRENYVGIEWRQEGRGYTV